MRPLSSFWRLGVFAGLLAATGLAVATIAMPTARRSPSVRDEAPVAAVVDAVFAENRLWLLSEGGRLASLQPDAPRADREIVPGRPLAICRSGDAPIALSEDAARGTWTLYARTAAKWSARQSLSADKNALIGFGCTDRGAVIVTDHRLLTVQDDGIRAVNLSTVLKPAFVRTTLLANGESIWVGFNNGEWGGGLIRIRRSDGNVEEIERNVSRTLCGGPLNGGCDPVNAIVPSPRDPSCVIAVVGLVHMMQHGRLVEVCGNAVRRLYYKADDPQPPYPEKGADEPASTIAFFGAARVGADIWVVGTDGIYRFSSTGTPVFRAMPEFVDRGGYRVSFDVPGVALVLTGMNGKVSMSGAVPLMVPR